MIRPDYRAFSHDEGIMHSPKGTTWKDHKYIKKINGVYYYTKNKLSQFQEQQRIKTEREKALADYQNSVDADIKRVKEDIQNIDALELQILGRKKLDDMLSSASSFLDRKISENRSEIERYEKDLEKYTRFLEKDRLMMEEDKSNYKRKSKSITRELMSK